VRGKGILNVCELEERGPVVLAFMVDKSERCQEQVDVMERVRPRFPAIRFAVVSIRGNRDEARRLIRERGWGMPVAWDRDGAVANAYAVAVCPTVTFARVGGQIERTSLGFLDEAALTRAIEEVAG
jgi:peroxiredoxin